MPSLLPVHQKTSSSSSSSRSSNPTTVANSFRKPWGSEASSLVATLCPPHSLAKEEWGGWDS